MANQFLIKETMTQMKNLLSSEIDGLKGDNPIYAGVQLLGYYEKGDTPSPIVYYLSTTETRADDGGSVIDTAGNKLVHDFIGRYQVEYFGVKGDGQFDNTTRYAALFSSAPNGAYIEFAPNKIYLGNIKGYKAVTINLNNATLIGVGNSDPCISIGNGTSPNYISVNTVYDYGIRSLTLESLNGISVGSLIVLSDSTQRYTDGQSNINSELLKVKAINPSTNMVTIEDIVRSKAITAPYKVEVVKTISGINIYGGSIINSFGGILINGAEDVEIRNIHTSNITKSNIRFLRCYKARCYSTSVSKAASTVAGEGYGIQFEYSREIIARDIKGSKMRHSIDLSATYNADLFNINCDEDLSTSIVIAHNTFGGNIKLDNATISLVDTPYMIQYSNQAQSNPIDLIARDITITNIKGSRPIGNTTSNFAIIFIGCSYSNLVIDNISYLSTNNFYTAPTQNHNIVRTYGVPLGNVAISNLSANKIGNAVWTNIVVNSNYTIDHEYPLQLNNIRLDTCLNLASLRFGKQIEISNVTVKSLIGDALVNVDPDDFGANIQQINFNDVIDYPDSKLLINTPSHYTKSYRGTSPSIQKNNDVIKDLSTIGIISEQDILSRTVLKLNNTSGKIKDIITTNGLPQPRLEGQKIRLIINDGNPVDSVGNHIRIPTGTANLNTPLAPIILESGKSYQMIANSDKKWDIFEEGLSKGFQSIRSISNKAIGQLDDLNKFTSQGGYVRFSGSSATIPNSPVQLPFILDVVKSPISNQITQTAYETTRSIIYYRSTADFGVTWTSWTSIGSNASVTAKGLVNQAITSMDTATVSSTNYSLVEVQGILAELRDLKTKLRTAGILAS